MQRFDFEDPSFLRELGIRAHEILQQSRNELINHPKFKILKMQYFDKLWQNRINKTHLFSLFIKEDDFNNINFRNINKEFQSHVFQIARTNNNIFLNESLNIIEKQNIPFSNSTDAKKYYKNSSLDGFCVLFFGEKGIDIFVKGENLGEINLFYCTEDIRKFSEKKNISQIHEVIKDYEVKYLSSQSEYMVFFADNSTLRQFDASLIRRNILKNKPEKYMRDHLKNYLNDRMQYTFGIETELSASKRELDIYTEVNGDFYFIEIKWLGQSIDDSGTKLTNPYGDPRAREGVSQTLEYIEELLTIMNVNVRAGYLVLFDARDDKQEINYQEFSFVRPELQPYMQLFEIMPTIELNKRHPA